MNSVNFSLVFFMLLLLNVINLSKQIADFFRFRKYALPITQAHQYIHVGLHVHRTKCTTLYNQ